MKDKTKNININDLITKDIDPETKKESIKEIKQDKKDVITKIMIDVVKNEKNRDRIA